MTMMLTTMTYLAYPNNQAHQLLFFSPFMSGKKESEKISRDYEQLGKIVRNTSGVFIHTSKRWSTPNEGMEDFKNKMLAQGMVPVAELWISGWMVYIICR